MSRFVAVELSARLLYVGIGPFEFAGESRSSEWPAQWSCLREAGSLEIWAGRLYLCLARKRATEIADPAGVTAEQQPECQILTFKNPVRAA